jgi:hypothetical protein
MSTYSKNRGKSGKLPKEKQLSSEALARIESYFHKKVNEYDAMTPGEFDELTQDIKDSKFKPSSTERQAYYAVLADRSKKKLIEKQQLKSQENEQSSKIETNTESIGWTEASNI